MKVYNECCKNCLLSKDSIVSPKRRKDILTNCAKNQTHFICHKASIDGKEIVCRTFYKILGHLSQMIRISERLGMIEFVPIENNIRLISHSEQTKSTP